MRLGDVEAAGRELRRLHTENWELLEALNRILSSVPAQDGAGGFIVEHHGMDGEFLGTQQIDPMWVIQEMAAVAQAALARAAGVQP